MGFLSKEKAKKYIPQDGDTLESIAERETQSGNAITWQDIAQYNWGTEDGEEIKTSFLTRSMLAAENSIRWSKPKRQMKQTGALCFTFFIRNAL